MREERKQTNIKNLELGQDAQNAKGEPRKEGVGKKWREREKAKVRGMKSKVGERSGGGEG